MKPVKVAILGAGVIARKMAETVVGMDTVEGCAVAARDLNRAQAFAKEFGFAKAYGSYEEMLADPEVELVYVATPHSHHCAHAKLCLEAGKHVLVEKAFTANATQAREVLELAEKKGLVAAEAIWPRYMPMADTLREICQSGIIGKVTTLTGNLGYVISNVPRLRDPALAGGALLDVGVYALTFASIVFGGDVQKVTSSAVLTDQGVDAQNSITLTYGDGRVAILNSSMLALSDRMGVLYGDRGFAIVENINNFEEIRVYDLDRKLIARHEQPKQLTGFEYELQSTVDAIRDGRLECPEMPHSEILRVMELMDGLRRDWGVRYPFEA